MRRFIRLGIAGLTFSAVGLLFALSQEWDLIGVRGGLTAGAIYSAVLATCVSLLGVVMIDDLEATSFWGGQRRGSPHPNRATQISRMPIGFTRAMWKFYSRPLTPILLLSFGAGLLVSGIANDLGGSRYFPRLPFDWYPIMRSEFVMAVLVVAISVVLLFIASAWAFVGFVLGMCGAAVVGEISFSDAANGPATALSWLIFAVAVIVVGCAIAVARRPWRHRDGAAPRSRIDVVGRIRIGSRTSVGGTDS